MYIHKHTQEHHYHVLEKEVIPSHPDGQAKLPKPDSPLPDTSPIYHEISELSGHGEGGGSVDDPGLSSPPVSVCLNITRLSSETVV